MTGLFLGLGWLIGFRDVDLVIGRTAVLDNSPFLSYIICSTSWSLHGLGVLMFETKVPTETTFTTRMTEIWDKKWFQKEKANEY